MTDDTMEVQHKFGMEEAMYWVDRNRIQRSADVMVSSSALPSRLGRTYCRGRAQVSICECDGPSCATK